MASIPGTGAAWTTTQGSGSPGACSVSRKCYSPQALVQGWVMPRLSALPNLQVFLRSAVIRTARSPVDGRLSSISIVQREPKADGPPEWSQRLSHELHDWFSTDESAAYRKRLVELFGKVFIEATELGDVLATSGLPFLQGVETPHETSPTSLSTCGQAATLTFFAELRGSHLPPPSPPSPPVPHGDAEGHPWTRNLTDAEFRHTWTWRRSWCNSDTHRSLVSVNVGDVTQQNLGNDLDSAYLLLPTDAVRAEAKAGWRGGVNTTALYMLEQRAYGWLRLMQSSAAALNHSWSGRVVLNRSTSGTRHGLSKFPYLRDTRRAVGVDGFRLLHAALRDTKGRTGVRFADSVALGEYNDDTHHLKNSSHGVDWICTYPKYIRGAGEGAKPYYIPMRALMVGGAPNLLVAGKTMAQSFHANSNTRTHPSEWSSGVAAGGIAALLVGRGWTNTSDALAHITDVRAFLNSSAVGQPLEWSHL